MVMQLREVDRVEIHTLQDNYYDGLAADDSEVIKRFRPVRDMSFNNSILAEHGFSALVTITDGPRQHMILFDFGFSSFGAASNARAMGLDLAEVDMLVLSHGHVDHLGGLQEMAGLVGRNGVELVVHPAAFRPSRFKKVGLDMKMRIPSLSKEKAEQAGLAVHESEGPLLLFDSAALFLGQVPRKTDYEKIESTMFYEENGEDMADDYADDSALAVHVRGKGLVVLTGCAHSGVINTITYAEEITGVKKVHAIMGGFHLAGADFDAVVKPTIESLKVISPDYVIPTHCTGRKVVNAMEAAMPESFLLNMSGTRMTFQA